MRHACGCMIWQWRMTHSASACMCKKSWQLNWHDTHRADTGSGVNQQNQVRWPATSTNTWHITTVSRRDTHMADTGSKVNWPRPSWKPTRYRSIREGTTTDRILSRPAPQWQLVNWISFDVGAARQTNKQINNETTGASVESWHSMAVDSQLISHNVRYILRDENSMNLNKRFQSKVVIWNMRVINKMSDSENYGRVKTEIIHKIKTINVDIIVRWTPPNYWGGCQQFLAITSWQENV